MIVMIHVHLQVSFINVHLHVPIMIDCSSLIYRISASSGSVYRPVINQWPIVKWIYLCIGYCIGYIETINFLRLIWRISNQPLNILWTGTHVNQSIAHLKNPIIFEWRRILCTMCYWWYSHCVTQKNEKYQHNSILRIKILKPP